MALEAAVFQQDIFGYSGKDLYNPLEENWSYNFGADEYEEHKGSLDFLGNQTENPFIHDEYHQCANSSSSLASMLLPQFNELQLPNSYSSTTTTDNTSNNSTSNEINDLNSSVTTRTKRRRSRSKKNQEEIENQRMTHIAVERNRRKQMNEYLSVLRSLMPESYSQRGDQASIIGGAINFVRELEHCLHFLGGGGSGRGSSSSSSTASTPFSEVFKFPQFTTSSPSLHEDENVNSLEANSTADIEVSMVESHASLKIRMRRRPKQLLMVVSGLQGLRFTVLHLNVSTIDDFVLYCFTLKVEEDCNLTSVADIATAVYQMLCTINQENAAI